MGVTLDGPNTSIDFGGSGFMRLRLKVAELTADDIFEHYKNLCYNMFKMSQNDFQEYDAKTESLNEKYNGRFSNILAFLYAPDTSAILNEKICADVYNVIKDYDDDIVYGYAGRKDCAKFADFKRVLLDCIENNTELEWF